MIIIECGPPGTNTLKRSRKLLLPGVPVSAFKSAVSWSYIIVLSARATTDSYLAANITPLSAMDTNRPLFMLNKMQLRTVRSVEYHAMAARPILPITLVSFVVACFSQLAFDPSNTFTIIVMMNWLAILRIAWELHWNESKN